MARTRKTARKSVGGHIPRRAFARRSDPPKPPQPESPLYTPTPSDEEPLEVADYTPSSEEYHVADSLPVDSEEDPQEPEEEEEVDIEADEDEVAEEVDYPEVEASEGRYAFTEASSGEEGGVIPGQLREMLQQVHSAMRPEYEVKMVPRPGRDEWTATVHIFQGARRLRTHRSPVPRAYREDAIVDVAWEAITVLHQLEKRRFQHTEFSYFPRRKSGERLVRARLVSHAVPRHHTAHSQKTILRMSGRLMGLQEELLTTRQSLKKAERALQRYRSEEDAGASSAHDEQERTWTATSPVRALDSDPPVESRRVILISSPASSASSHA